MPQAQSVVCALLAVMSALHGVDSLSIVDLLQLRSSFECQAHGGTADTRLCLFTNLCVAEGKLYFLTAGEEAPELPNITVNWHGQVLAEVELLDTSLPPANLSLLPVATVEKGIFQHVAWADNFYHSMEAVLAFHLKACEFFGHCNSSSNPATAPQLFRIEPEHDLGNPDPASYDWLAAHPNVKEAMACLTPHPAPHILNAELRGQVTLVQSAVIGIGRSNRIFSGPETRPGFHEVYQAPEPWLVDAFRERMAHCAGTSIPDLQGSSQLNISIVNRGDNSGRHILNEQDMRRRIQHEFRDDVHRVRVIRPDEMDFEEQLRAFAGSSLVILTHGAAMANLMFIPKGAAVIEYMWHKEMAFAHNWLVDIIRDMHLNCSLVGIHTIDDRLGEWRREMFLYQPGFKKMNNKQRLAFYENKPDLLPKNLLEGLDRKHMMNFALDWSVLRPAIELAIADIRSGNHTFHFLRT